MKKIGTIFLVILVSVAVFLLGFKSDVNTRPNEYYEVYLEGDLLGTVKSEKELNDYIQKQGENIKSNVRNYKTQLDLIDIFNNLKDKISDSDNEKIARDLLNNYKSYNLNENDISSLNDYLKYELYKLNDSDIEKIKEYVDSNEIYLSIDHVYTPNGTKIKKVYTYDDNTISVEEMYKKLVSNNTFTIPGYIFNIKANKEGKKDIIIYTTDPKVFSSAIEKLITIFVDEKDYNSYKNNTQKEIDTTGKKIENIYIDEQITYKASNIPVTEKIYTDSNDLSAYLLYGEKFEEKKVTVQKGDSIESVAFDNQISTQEFLIFNTEYKDENNLLVPGTEVVISTVDPKISVIVETHEVVDKETNFNTVEKHDPNLTQGSVVVAQEGEKGLERVTQNVKYSNGSISYVDPVDKKTIKNAQSKVISVGTKYVATVGSTASWGWPTNSGYTFSSYYGYRISVFGEGNFHSGLDIAGTGYGSPVYATNNGVIVERKYTNTYGNYIMIDHNNGYYSLYAHMSRFKPGLSVGSTVERGQTIGYVGSSGWATGPHLHYEIRTCKRYACTTNPLKFYQ